MQLYYLSSNDIKKDISLWHRCFPVSFVKFIRTPFFIEHLWWLFLNFQEENVKVRITAEDFEAKFNKLEQYGYSTDATMLKYLEWLTQ